MAHADASAFGRELRRLRQHAGVSLNRLAESVHYSKSYLSKVENGVKPATRDLATRCEEALGVAEGALVGLCPRRARTRAAADRGDPWTGGVLVPRQLPAPVRHFSGRRRELALLDRIFTDREEEGGTSTGGRAHRPSPLIAALCGTGGIGKTALAVHWAHRAADRYADGQLFVNLRGFDPTGAPLAAAEALRGFLDAFQVPAGQVPVGLDAQAALYRSITAAKRLLVVLDNARDAEQVRPLLPAGPGCSVLVTSRDPLAGLVAAQGARPVALDLFGAQSARELLTAQLGGEPVAAEQRAADELLELCAGLPLAINIAAARAATRPDLSLAGQVEQMRAARSRLDALSTGDRATDVRGVFSWSYRLLRPEAMRLFRLLGLHPGATIARPAAASLLGVGREQVRAPLEELTRAHLLTRQSDGRYALHDLLRAYAAELVAAMDEDEARRAALSRVFEHYMLSAQHAAHRLNSQAAAPARQPATPGVEPERFADYGEAMAWFEAERACLTAIVAAAANGHESHAWRLSAALTTFLDRRSLWTELAEVQRIALAAARRLDDAAAEAGSLRGLGRACMRLRTYDASRDHLRRARDIYEKLGDPAGLAHTNHDLALVSEQEGRPEEALDYAIQAWRGFQAAGNLRAEANSLNTVGWFYAMTGRYEAALEHCGQALARYRDLGDADSEQAGTWDSLGVVHHRLADYAQAASAYERAIDLYRKTGDRYYEAGTLVRLGETRHAAGDLKGARTARSRALTLLAELQHPDAEKVRAMLDEDR